jgi:hypothetical protein
MKSAPLLLFFLFLLSNANPYILTFNIPMISEDVVIECSSEKMTVNGTYEFKYIGGAKNHKPEGYVYDIKMPIYVPMNDSLVYLSKKYQSLDIRLTKDEYNFIKNSIDRYSGYVDFKGAVDSIPFEGAVSLMSQRSRIYRSGAVEDDYSVPLPEQCDAIQISAKMSKSIFNKAYNTFFFNFKNEHIDLFNEDIKKYYKKRGTQWNFKKFRYKREYSAEYSTLTLSYNQRNYIKDNDTLSIYTPIILNDTISPKENYSIQFVPQDGYSLQLVSDNEHILVNTDSLIQVLGVHKEPIIVKTTTQIH